MPAHTPDWGQINWSRKQRSGGLLLAEHLLRRVLQNPAHLQQLMRSVILSDSLRHGGLEPARLLSVHGILQARILEWVAMLSLQGILLTQGLNPGLPHHPWMSHQGSPTSSLELGKPIR